MKRTPSANEPSPAPSQGCALHMSSERRERRSWTGKKSLGRKPASPKKGASFAAMTPDGTAAITRPAAATRNPTTPIRKTSASPELLVT